MAGENLIALTKNLIQETTFSAPTAKSSFDKIFDKIWPTRFFWSFVGHKGHLVTKSYHRTQKNGVEAMSVGKKFAYRQNSMHTYFFPVRRSLCVLSL